MVSPIGSAAAAAGTPSATSAIIASARRFRISCGRTDGTPSSKRPLSLAAQCRSIGAELRAPMAGQRAPVEDIMKLSRRSFVGGALAAPFIAQPGFGQALGSVLRVIPHADLKN